MMVDPLNNAKTKQQHQSYTDGSGYKYHLSIISSVSYFLHQQSGLATSYRDKEGLPFIQLRKLGLRQTGTFKIWKSYKIVFLLTSAVICSILSAIIIIIIIKRGWQCKAGRERLTPYQSEDPNPTTPTHRKKRKGKQ